MGEGVKQEAWEQAWLSKRHVHMSEHRGSRRSFVTACILKEVQDIYGPITSMATLCDQPFSSYVMFPGGIGNKSLQESN